MDPTCTQQDARYSCQTIRPQVPSIALRLELDAAPSLGPAAVGGEGGSALSLDRRATVFTRVPIPDSAFQDSKRGEASVTGPKSKTLGGGGGGRPCSTSKPDSNSRLQFQVTKQPWEGRPGGGFQLQMPISESNSKFKPWNRSDTGFQFQITISGYKAALGGATGRWVRITDSNFRFQFQILTSESNSGIEMPPDSNSRLQFQVTKQPWEDQIPISESNSEFELWNPIPELKCHQIPIPDYNFKLQSSPGRGDREWIPIPDSNFRFQFQIPTLESDFGIEATPDSNSRLQFQVTKQPWEGRPERRFQFQIPISDSNSKFSLRNPIPEMKCHRIPIPDYNFKLQSSPGRSDRKDDSNSRFQFQIPIPNSNSGIPFRY